MTERPVALRILAPAKVNLGLWIRRRRADGYHDVLTIFQAVDLYDELLVIPRPRGFTLRCDAPGVPTGERNLVIRAARLMRERALTAGFRGGRAGRRPGPRMLGASFVLHKRIPHGAGLGGGSSDAAAAIVALNRAWGLGLSLSALRKIALEVGSDVPFFLTGGAAVGKGRGNRLIPLRVGPGHAFVLVHSPSAISTKWAYSQFKNGLTRPKPPPRIAALSSGDAVSHVPINEVYNALEAGLRARYPDIVARRQRLLAFGARVALLTGSGSTVYGIFSSLIRARKAVERLRREGYNVDLARSVEHGVAIAGDVGQ